MELPKPVNETLKHLRQEFPFYIVLQSKNGNHYLYKHSTKWDAQSKKVRTSRTYLGKITDDGKFLRKLVRSAEQEEMAALPEGKMPMDEKDSVLLTVLSMNARADLAYHGRKLGMKPEETYRRVKNLEKRFGITYITEIDVEKLGYLKLLVMVKFIDKKPGIEEIRSVAERVHAVQLALLVNGDYDLVFYVFVKKESADEIPKAIIGLRVGELEGYKSRWYTAPFYEHHGFVPIRNEFIEDIKEELKKREYAVLREVNKNSVADFAEIDRKYGLERMHSGYVYSTLKENGVIRRATISMQKLPIKYIGILQQEIIDESEFRKRRELQLEQIIEDAGTPTNKYVLGGDTENPDGTILFAPIFSNGELDIIMEKIRKQNSGIEIKQMIVTSILLGSLCYRKFDVKYSRQYAILVNTYGAKPERPVDYYMTSRGKKDKNSS
ncbi:MAG: hypothetical protein KGH77_03920 [Candidatus Micrarchaeota archaeon]|nr:hypothetical protein [Candidatus Micrarchaeota archaeon]MDE1864548.1 hypothetical protein [Candidatus Micrarchaeota archaeon]